MNKTPIYILLLLCLIVSCSNNKLEYSYKFAEGNADEIIKVINHFKDQPLKLKAAEYLIENMAIHYSYENSASEYYNSLLNESIKISRKEKEIRNKAIKRIDDSLKQVYGVYDKSIIEKKYDLKSIKSSYLINHIEESYKCWNNKWCKHLSFEQFCRFILPYRVGSEPIEDWRKIISKELPWIKDIKNSELTSYEAICRINDSLKNIINFSDIYDKLTDQPISDMLRVKIGKCNDMTTFATLIMRTAGLPVTVVSQARGHSWNVFIDEDGNWRDFMSSETNPCDSIVSIHYKVFNRYYSKVYLKTFHIPKNRLKIISANTGIRFPGFMYSNTEDITSKIMNTKDVTFTLNDEIKNRYGYLMSFRDNSKMGDPISFTTISDNKAVFKDVGVDGNYYLAIYNNGQFEPVSNMLHLNIDSTYRFIPDKSQLNSCKLYRKAKESKAFSNFVKGHIGATIDAANNKNFKNSIQIATINSPYYNFSGDKCQKDVEAKYVRLTPFADSALHIAEFALYNNRGEKIEAKPFSEFNKDYSENICDNNIRTNFNGEKGEWIGFELKERNKISGYKILARNNFNVVEKGDSYELFYFDHGWRSLGVQKADTNFVEYKNIPKGAICVLRNITKGKREDLFSIENGKHKWWHKN